MKPAHRGFVFFSTLGLSIGLSCGLVIGGITGNTVGKEIITKVQKIKVTLGAKDFAKNLLTPIQYWCLDTILMRESHWNAYAKESTTKAFGIGQLLPITWLNLGYKETSNSNAQVLATLVYIARHYSDSSNGVCVAAQHSQKYGWY